MANYTIVQWTDSKPALETVVGHPSTLYWMDSEQVILRVPIQKLLHGSNSIPVTEQYCDKCNLLHAEKAQSLIKILLIELCRHIIVEIAICYCICLDFYEQSASSHCAPGVVWPDCSASLTAVALKRESWCCWPPFSVVHSSKKIFAIKHKRTRQMKSASWFGSISPSHSRIP